MCLLARHFENIFSSLQMCKSRVIFTRQTISLIYGTNSSRYTFSVFSVWPNDTCFQILLRFTMTGFFFRCRWNSFKLIVAKKRCSIILYIWGKIQILKHRPWQHRYCFGLSIRQMTIVFKYHSISTIISKKWNYLFSTFALKSGDVLHIRRLTKRGKLRHGRKAKLSLNSITQEENVKWWIMIYESLV